MRRSYMLQPMRPQYLRPLEEVLFPEISKHQYPIPTPSRMIFSLFRPIQNTRQTINPHDMFQSQPFIYIDHQNAQFHCELQELQQYADDKLKFVTKVKVDESRCTRDNNKINLVKEPVYCSGDTITFLLVLQWFPNYVKVKHVRKGSFASQKQLGVRTKQKTRSDVQDILSAVFLLSEKIYIEERYIDEFMNIIAERHQVHHRQLNCLTIFQKQLNDKSNPNTHSTQAETKYFYYQNQGGSSYNYVLASEMDRSSIRAHTQNLKPLTLNRNSSSKPPQSSPKSSLISRSAIMREQPKQLNFNIKKVKKYFSTVEYLISDSQLELQVIIYHLNDNRNSINSGFILQTIEQLFKQWTKWGSYSQLYTLNRDQILTQTITQCVRNYQQMAAMQLSQLDLTTLDNIYTVIKQFNAKMTTKFVQETSEFVFQPSYSDYLKRLSSQLNILQQQLMNHYSLTKGQYGERIIRNLLKKSNRLSGQNYALTKIVGKEEINKLDIGFRTYKKIIEDKLPQVFMQLTTKGALNRYTWRGKVHSDQNELNNIENRIDLCQERKKGLDREILLIERQAQILEDVLRAMQNVSQEGDSVSERRTLKLAL